MELKKATFEERPALFDYEGENVRINFDIEEKTIKEETSEGEDPKEKKVYEANVVRVAHPVTRDRIVDAIITAAYPADVMQAVINNHMMESESEEHNAEFAAMQQWRAHAKDIAGQVIAEMQA